MPAPRRKRQSSNDFYHTNHSEQRKEERGITDRMIEEVIEKGKRRTALVGGYTYFYKGIYVGTSNTGEIKTVYRKRHQFTFVFLVFKINQTLAPPMYSVHLLDYKK